MRRIQDFELGQESVVVERILRMLEARFIPTDFPENDTALMPSAAASEESTERHQLEDSERADLQVVDGSKTESPPESPLPVTQEVLANQTPNKPISKKNSVNSPEDLGVETSSWVLYVVIGLGVGVGIWVLLKKFVFGH